MKNRLWSGALMMLLGLAACDDGGGDTGAGGSGGKGGSGQQGGSGGKGGQGAGDASAGGGAAGGGTTTTGDGGTTTTGTGGEGGDDLAPLSDDFEDPSTMDDWLVLNEVLGLPPPHEVLDIDTTVEGKLVIVPTVSAWYQDQMATFVYKVISGNFLVEVDAAAVDRDTVNGAPTEQYNSAGMLIRDPASVPGDQSWLMYNIGHQAQWIGMEGKATVGSQSELPLVPTNGVYTGTLRMCRIGNVVRMLRRLPGESEWTQTHQFPDSFPATPAFTLPETVQVGMIDNAYQVADVRAEFAHIHFRRVSEPDDCTAD